MTLSKIVLSLFAATFVASFASADTYVEPALNFVDNLNGSVTLQVVTTPSNGSVGTEISAVDGSITGTGSLVFTNAFITDPSTFVHANPGHNPITGTITDGLYLDSLNQNKIFVSFGGSHPSKGALDFLTIEYTGVGTINAFGLVAQRGQIHYPAMVSIDVVPEPCGLLLMGVTCMCAMALRHRL